MSFLGGFFFGKGQFFNKWNIIEAYFCYESMRNMIIWYNTLKNMRKLFFKLFSFFGMVAKKLIKQSIKVNISWLILIICFKWQALTIHKCTCDLRSYTALCLSWTLFVSCSIEVDLVWGVDIRVPLMITTKFRAS